MKQIHGTTMLQGIKLAIIVCVLGMAGCAMGPVIGEGIKWEEVSRAGQIFGEGVVADKEGRIYASDITSTLAIKENNPGGVIYRYDPRSGQTERFLQPSRMSNGLHVDKNGDLLIAQGADGGGRGVVRRNLSTGVMTPVAANFEGKSFNAVNDVTSDSRGRIYFTDSRFGGNDRMDLPNSVYRVDLDGRVTDLRPGVERPNGVEVSPDGKKLYVSVSNLPRFTRNPHGPAKDAFGVVGGGVIAFDLDTNGNISNGNVIYRSGEVMVTDGMALDTDGNIYVSMHNGNPKEPRSNIVVISPSGEELAQIPLPGNALATNVGFGRGADASSLYANSALPWRLWRIKTTRRGHYFE
ncbi:MAG: SMP-30/gluconolactonase/LRE family protein [Burkholderiales bacterium]